ncbi:hypothetical protein CFB81_25115 [Burkholderia sp. AU28863]|nr:hypothetical protein CFB81_25115 [Burkholderia sp. AU28863]
MSSPSSLHAQRSTGAGAAAPAPFRVARRTVTSLRAAFAALPSCLLVCLLVRLRGVGWSAPRLKAAARSPSAALRWCLRKSA